MIWTIEIGRKNHSFLSLILFIYLFCVCLFVYSNKFTEDDWKLVQLVFTLFRNILAVQEIPLHLKSAGSASHFLSLRDKFLELLFRENVMDIILVVSQNVGSSNVYLRQDNLLLLEIFHYIFTGQDPELIIRGYSNESKVTSLNFSNIIS